MGKILNNGIVKMVQYEFLNILIVGGLTLAEVLLFKKIDKGSWKAISKEMSRIQREAADMEKEEREKSLAAVQELLNRKPPEQDEKMTSEEYLRNISSYVKAIKWNSMSDEEKIKEAARRMGYDVGD